MQMMALKKVPGIIFDTSQLNKAYFNSVDNSVEHRGYHSVEEGGGSRR
jgi:hypothetical protein